MKKIWLALIAMIVTLTISIMAIGCAKDGGEVSESSQTSTTESSTPKDSSGSWSGVFLPPAP